MEKIENRLIIISWILCAIVVAIAIIPIIGNRTAAKAKFVEKEEVINTNISVVIGSIVQHDTIQCPQHLYQHYRQLINAIVHVESKGDTALVGHCGDAGMMQQLPVSVKEANRLNSFNNKTYSLQDRFDPKSQIEMFLIIQHYHNKRGDYETAARLWNGNDPKKHKRSTARYWKRVQIAMVKNYNYEHLWN